MAVSVMTSRLLLTLPNLVEELSLRFFTQKMASKMIRATLVVRGSVSSNFSQLAPGPFVSSCAHHPPYPLSSPVYSCAGAVTHSLPFLVAAPDGLPWCAADDLMRWGPWSLAHLAAHHAMSA